MKYAPHPWDKYGSPVIDDSSEGEDVEALEELEDRADELRDYISDKEREIEDLEDDVSVAEQELHEIEQQIRAASKPTPGQTRHSDEY